jgi:hypothetical protein
VRCQHLSDAIQDAGRVAAELGTGHAKDFEERGAKPQARTRARLAKVLRAPDLERFGDGDGRGFDALVNEATRVVWRRLREPPPWGRWFGDTASPFGHRG